MRTNRFTAVWGALLLGVWAALALPGTAEAKPSQGVKVERREFPVRLSDGHTYTVVGYLYYQGSLKNRPVQILTHGITYNHEYWDLPEINGEDYSYARYMARQHYAVLALDLPGVGESDRPQGDFIDLEQSASALHQVAQRLRATAEKNTFETLIYVGHSNGALISTVAQAQYHDAQAVVMTGWLNTLHEVPVDPALLIALAEQGPYITIPGELRGGLFYDAQHTDPSVVAYDNQVADTVPRGQFLDLLTVLGSPESIPVQGITVPLLVQLGEKDLLASAAYAHQEAKAYPNSPWVVVRTLPDTGHAVNGHSTRERSWAGIDAWLRLVTR
ncbi:alpha/beta fold hydrolase [Archangium violaceum]|uniref:alpha/beta hydrolase n=1 Tax=Archangium violaceum TaxID=83451 RepID=UPI00194EDD5B|nr:alpha/beta fold hydrolase [Archangium violaceum]QRN94877.1 alpha/beta fold hydrolase [Archangium violaceum]